MMAVDGFQNGPWTLGRCDTDNGVAWSIRSASGGLVSGGLHAYPADARLIAAAPELYDLLQQAVDLMPCTNIAGSSYDWVEAADKWHEAASVLLERIDGVES